MSWQSVRFEREIRRGDRGRVESQMREARDQHGRQAIEQASAWDPWNSWHYALGAHIWAQLHLAVMGDN